MSVTTKKGLQINTQPYSQLCFSFSPLWNSFLPNQHRASEVLYVQFQLYWHFITNPAVLCVWV